MGSRNRERKLSFSTAQETSNQTKRNRTGSISGRLRAASDLADVGLIAAEDKGLVKDLIITEDTEFLEALDKFSSNPNDQSAVQKILKQSRNRRGSIDLLEGIDLDFLGADPDDLSASDISKKETESPFELQQDSYDLDYATGSIGNSGQGAGGGQSGSPATKSRSASAATLEMFGNYFSEGISMTDFDPGLSNNKVPSFGGHSAFEAEGPGRRRGDSKSSDYTSTASSDTGGDLAAAEVGADSRPRLESSDWGVPRPRLGSDLFGIVNPHSIFDMGSDIGVEPSYGRGRANSSQTIVVGAGGKIAFPVPSAGGKLGFMQPPQRSSGLRNSPVPSFQELMESTKPNRCTSPIGGVIEYAATPNPYAIICPPGQGSIGAYTAEERRTRIQRFLEKRQRRVWTKRVKYDVRKNFADSRIRVKGRFVKKEDENALRAAAAGKGK